MNGERLFFSVLSSVSQLSLLSVRSRSLCLTETIVDHPTLFIIVQERRSPDIG